MSFNLDDYGEQDMRHIRGLRYTNQRGEGRHTPLRSLRAPDAGGAGAGIRFRPVLRLLQSLTLLERLMLLATYTTLAVRSTIHFLGDYLHDCISFDPP